ncbi:MAG: SCO family protein [Candidatus Hydrogenedentes bacterium]|nr:SCO family protein [Candidatus Hydrogenedentota bacterium]
MMKRSVKHIIALTAAGLLLSVGIAAGIADAQPVDQGVKSDAGVDPFSLRGPDPRDQYREIIIDQKLNQQVPLNLEFRDEQGKSVRLREYFNGKPVVLSLVYYECPMLCNLVLNGMVAGFDAADNSLAIDNDYEVLTVSIDPQETPELARAKKETYLAQYHKPNGAEGWHFLTGDQDNIEDLAQAVGFRYYYDPAADQFAHASGIMILTPDGKVSSYYLGIEYLPRKLELALVDAGKGAIGTLADQLVLLCYQYDPSKGAYGLVIMNVLRLGAAGIVVFVLGFWLVHFLQTKRRRPRRPEQYPGHA